MAIAYDTGTGNETNSGTSVSWSHTCTGSDRILWVYVMNSSAVNVTSVTYNGVELTLAVGNGSSQRSRLYYLIAPATGANTVQVNLASTSYVYCASASYTGVAQTGQPDATGFANNGASPRTTSVTTVADNCWTVLGARAVSTGNTSASTNSTKKVDRSGYVQFYDNNTEVSPAGSYSMTVTTTLGNINTVMASMAPAVAVTTFTPKVMWFS